MNDKCGCVVDASIAPSDLDEAQATLRKRRIRDERIEHLAIAHELVNAVAAKNERITASELNPGNVWRIHRTIADHSCGIIGRASGWRSLSKIAIRVIACKELDALRGAATR